MAQELSWNKVANQIKLMPLWTEIITNTNCVGCSQLTTTLKHAAISIVNTQCGVVIHPRLLLDISLQTDKPYHLTPSHAHKEKMPLANIWPCVSASMAVNDAPARYTTPV